VIFVLTPGAGLLVGVAVHLLVSRAAPGFPRPRGVVVAVLGGLAAVIALARLAGRGGPAGTDWGTTLAWSLAYLALAFTYVFGFYNLGESARRIRLLLELRDAGPRGLALEEIRAGYSARAIVEARLARMLAGAQIAERDGRYVIRQSLVLTIAKILLVGKLVLFGAPGELGAARRGRA
jgi:hypothetical protein